MVVERSDVKRRRKDAQDHLEGSPKRTKVHAQRKFAQGSGVNSPAMTPIKEKVKPNGIVSPPELLPAKRPNTEDFLTFLCFRGTKSLPPRLNFFNVAYKPEKEETDGSSPSTSKPSPSTNTDTQEESPKPKRVSQVKLKLNQTPAVQALKKKYREQRLAKKKASITELVKKVKGKNMIRTRSKVFLEERNKKQKTTVEAVPKLQQSKLKPSTTVLVKRLGLNRVRAGLRSSGKLPPGSDLGIKTDRKPRRIMNTKPGPSKPLARKIVKPISSDQNDEKSSDNDEPSAKKSRPVLTRSSRAITARRILPPSTLPNLKTRPTRKTKEAAAIYMEILTKNLRSPDEYFEDSASVESFPELPITRRNSKEPKQSEVKEQVQKVKNIKQITRSPKPSSKERQDSSKSSSKERKDDSKSSSKERKETVKIAKEKKDDSTSSKERKIDSKSSSKERKIDLKPTSKEKKEDIKSSTDGEKEESTKPVKGRSKGGSGIITRKSQGKKSFDGILVNTDIKAAFEPRPTRKSSNKTREASPPQRVLRTKRNRISLAENEDETDEDELFFDAVEEEEQPKKQLPRRNKLIRNCLKVESDSDIDSENDTSVKKGTPISKVKKTEKKVVKKVEKLEDSVLLSQESNKDSKAKKKDLKEEKDEPSKQNKKSNKNEIKNLEEEIEEIKTDDVKTPKNIVKVKRTAAPKIEEDISDLKIETKPLARRLSRKSTAKSEESLDQEKQDKFKEEKKSDEKSKIGNKVVLKKDSIKVENKNAKKQTKKEIPESDSYTSTEEIAAKQINSNKANDNPLKTKNITKLSTESKQEKKSKVPDEVIPVVPNCKVIIESLDALSKSFPKSDPLNDPNPCNNNNNNQKNLKIKESQSSDLINEKLNNPKVPRNYLKKRQASLDSSGEGNSSEDNMFKRKLGKETLNANIPQESENMNSSKIVDELVQEKKSNKETKKSVHSKDQRCLNEIVKLNVDSPLVNISKEPLSESNKEISPQKSESGNKQNQKSICTSHLKVEQDSSSASIKKSVPTNETNEDVKTEMNVKIEPEGIKEEKSAQSTFKNLEGKYNKGISKPIEPFATKFNRSQNIKGNDAVIPLMVNPNTETLPFNLKLEKPETHISLKEIANKNQNNDLISKKEQLHIDTNFPQSDKIIQDRQDICGENLLINVQSSNREASMNTPLNSPAKSNQTESPKSKPSIGDTWRQAFKNAKIPKPGQLSPIPHTVKPFVRKSFSNQAFMKQSQLKSNNSESTGKLTDESIVKDSPSKINVLGNTSSMGFPKRRYMLDSAKDHENEKKLEKVAVKSLTLLQFERRTSELVSGLKETPLIESNFLSVAPRPILNSKLTEKPEPSKEKVTTTEMKEITEEMPPVKPTSEGKHLNLPLPVEHTLRKLSTSTVSKKPQPNTRYQLPPEVKELVSKNFNKNVDEPVKPPPCKSPDHPHKCFEKEFSPSELVVNKPGDVDLMMKKKVNMTAEEINRWLNDSTSSGIEHTKDCGIFERNQCECSFRTSGSSMEGSVGISHLVPPGDIKVGKSVVQPPVQLKELDVESKFCTETISTCKVEDYKEKILSKKSSISEGVSEKSSTEFKLEKNDKNTVSPLTKAKKEKQTEKMVVEKAFKSPKSMTEDEMCEYDFRFERNPTSPNESGSEMSSPTLRDDVSSSNEETPEKHPEHRKSIFHQKRNVTKRYPLSKSPSAFSPENESSVYAFEPDLPVKAKPFRRRGKSGEGPASSSIAVQVNLETEAVLECSTQTERDAEEEGHLFYIPLQQSPDTGVPPQQLIQGVAVKLDTEGPDQRVIMRAKLVTKPASTVTPNTRSLVNNNGGSRGKPEQKVRPLGKPPVGTVQPTVREPKRTDQSTGTDEERPPQTTQATQACPPVKEIPPPPPPPPPPPAPQAAPSKPMKRLRGLDDHNPREKRTVPIVLKKKAKQSVEASSKIKPQPVVTISNEFPAKASNPCLVEAPTFRPTEKEFQDPLEYIDKITPQAQQFGICRIVPPSNFKPECKVSDDMRFTAYNQYIHKMLNRWGPNVKEMSAIRKYLATQSIALTQPPWIGGMEVDLPRLYQTVQQCGGLKEVIEKKRWTRVADAMKIPKSAQDRVAKLDDIYCKFLLPYDTLSHEERNKLLDEVEQEWKERERKVEDGNNSDSDNESDDRDECITKGRSMALSAFYRIARNTMAMWFKDTPSPQDVETEFWKHVSTGMSHVCVHSGSIDSGTWGYGFPIAKSSSTSRHPWNLKVLTNNSGSILRSMGPLMGVTVPTLHVGMLFSACCWYRDPHALPWIEYLHTGASKIWYGVPDEWSGELRTALKSLLPRYVRDKPIWLASDTAMVPPGLLVERGVALSRLTQDPGQFVLVFPRAFTSSVSTGYLVSESVYFARPSWLDSAEQVFKDVQDSCEPTMFSLEKLLFCIATDARSSVDVLNQVLPMVVSIRESEVRKRRELEGLGLVGTDRLPVSKGRRARVQEDHDDYECEACRANLFLSLVANSHEEANYCLAHAVELLMKDSSQLKFCKLLYGYDEEEMEELIEKVKSRIEMKSQKKPHNKNSNVASATSSSKS